MAESKNGGWGSKKAGGKPQAFVIDIKDAIFEYSTNREGVLVEWRNGNPINLNLEGPISRVTLDEDNNIVEYGEAYEVPEGYDHARKSYLLGTSQGWVVTDEGGVSAKDGDDSPERNVGNIVESMPDGFEGDLDALGDWNNPETWVGLSLVLKPVLALNSKGVPIKDGRDRDVYNDYVVGGNFSAKPIDKKMQKAIRTIVEDCETVKEARKVLASSDLDTSELDADELTAFIKKSI